ncbi:MAG: ATP-binding protein [Bacteroidetes bacterium HGW-Bacteroidetes-11]|jgi:signal transduction histidine kinase|nr:MAG: ATP-binding protein [Bacteroidetes bacterium HGW-Bacteroidetes-11]
MGFKKFRTWIVIRVILITVNLLLLVILLQNDQQWVTALITGVIALMQVAALIHYSERTNRKLTQFLESVRHSDFSTSFYDKDLGKSFEGLNRSFNEVIREFRKNRAEKEEHYNYLLTVVQHVSIGIIAFRKDGKVDIFNNAIKRLLQVTNLKHINDLASIKPSLPENLLKMKAGDKQLIKLVVENELLQLSVYATEFRMRGEEFLLVSLQNISAELEEKEIESWQKLIRVLTHEIMNSITPISSLASTVREMLLTENEDDVALRDLDSDDVENIQLALTTIQSRSQGLLNFVETYRNLTRIPRPNFRYFAVKELFERTHMLLRPKMEKYGIECIPRVFPEELMITADPDLVEQVFINMLLNAIDAVKEKPQPQIKVTASPNNNGRVSIDFSDNGYGIKPDILDKIFMPFFTSKKDGSGIGLSLSRQIMHLHKGSVTVKSIPGEGTVFTLTF